MPAPNANRPTRSWLVFRNTTLAILIGVFAIGWTTGPGDDLVYPVNMTLADDRLFVSDRYNGVHVFDVADAEAPYRSLHIPLNGNRGTAVRGDIMYANDYKSLLVVRVKDDGYEVINEIELSGAPFSPQPFVMGGVESESRFGCACSTNNLSPERAPSSGGTGSSFATFAVAGDYLYYLDYSSLVTLDISVPEEPKELKRTSIGWTVETLYPAGDLLFVGGTNGMYIFDRRDPAAPQEVGRVEHFRACDPVVVSGGVAYVTLRGGTNCGMSNDVLLCVSVEDPSNPLVIAEKELTTPYGLTVRDPFLYVSNGYEGFELLDIARPTEPSVVASWREWATKDFIWDDNVLYVLGFEDLRIFDTSKPDNPVLLAIVKATS